MFQLVVDEPYPLPIPGEGPQYLYQQGVHQLILFFARPKRHEVQAVESGHVRFALTPVRDTPTILFLLFEFPGAIRWSDAPYHVGLAPDDQRPLVESLNDHIRLGIGITLVDQATSVVRALRFVSFSPQFSRSLNATIRTQLEEPFEPAAYDAALQRAYQRFPTPRALLEQSIVRCTGGA